MILLYVVVRCGSSVLWSATTNYRVVSIIIILWKEGPRDKSPICHAQQFHCPHSQEAARYS